MILHSLMLTYPNFVGKLVYAMRENIRDNTSAHHLAKVLNESLNSIMTALHTKSRECNAWQKIIGLLLASTHTSSQTAEVLAAFGQGVATPTLVSWINDQGPKFRDMLDYVCVLNASITLFMTSIVRSF